MPRCGSQIILCNFPIRIDTYQGCSHGCKYCFAQRKKDIANVTVGESPRALLEFIRGKRSIETNWCDWDIPLHMGGMSDPFQPCELKMKNTERCMQILADTQYPFIVSTKGTNILLQRLDLLKECKVVVQVSMVCSAYDKYEKGAPTFQERMRAIPKIAKSCLRVIGRIQPFIPEVLPQVIKHLSELKNMGVHGVTVEGMKANKKFANSERLGNEFVVETKIMKNCLNHIKTEAHCQGLAFYAAENRFREMGDSTSCCGVDGLPGFVPCTANLNSLKTKGKVVYRANMKKVGTAYCFKTMDQTTTSTKYFQKASYAEVMDMVIKSRSFHKKMGIFGC
jgi:DNA repair photolyase